MRYGHITDGAVDQGPIGLPSAWDNISGLNNLSDEELRPLGWLPWILVEVPVGPDQVLDGSTVVVEETQIVETQKVRDLTPEEIASMEQQQRDSNKQQASYLLTSVDWVELGDVDNPANPPYLTNKADFTAYRQQLREIAVNPPVTVNEWPTKPEEQWSSI
jgi:hypothetical protein